MTVAHLTVLPDPVRYPGIESDVAGLLIVATQTQAVADRILRECEKKKPPDPLDMGCEIELFSPCRLSFR